MPFDILPRRHAKLFPKAFAEIIWIVVATGFGKRSDIALADANQVLRMIHAHLKDIIANGGVCGAAIDGAKILSADKVSARDVIQTESGIAEVGVNIVMDLAD